MLIAFCLIGFFALMYIKKILYFKSHKWKNVLSEYSDIINKINFINEKATAAIKNMYFYNQLECAKSVVKNAKSDPFKFTCKYFGLKSTEETIDLLTNLANNFEVLRNNLNAITVQKNHCVKQIATKIPFFVRLFETNIEHCLQINNIVTIKYPQYRFLYKTSLGNIRAEYIVEFNPKTIRQFIELMEDEIHYRSHIKLQRSLMTDKLRDFIKKRDNYTCQICGDSIYKNPHIEFHIDHIIPVSKGGITEEDNLQTLCASCNLHKSNKI